jgi:toxin ParE1/3/4
MVQVVWTEPALADVEAIVRHIALDSRVYAERMASRIMSATRRLEHAPEMGQFVPELGDERFRELLCRSYRVIYRYSPKLGVCHIAAVVHTSRDFLAAVEDRELD